MRLLGAKVNVVESGSRTLKDATNEAMRDWMGSVENTHYILGSVVGPHPFPLIVRNHILGTLHISFKETPDYLSELSEMLNDVSKQIAIAVGNMVAYTQLVDEKQHLEREKQYLMRTSEDYQPDKHIAP